MLAIWVRSDTLRHTLLARADDVGVDRIGRIPRIVCYRRRPASSFHHAVSHTSGPCGLGAEERSGRPQFFCFFSAVAWAQCLYYNQASLLYVPLILLDLTSILPLGQKRCLRGGVRRLRLHPRGRDGDRSGRHGGGGLG